MIEKRTDEELEGEMGKWKGQLFRFSRDQFSGYYTIRIQLTRGPGWTPEIIEGMSPNSYEEARDDLERAIASSLSFAIDQVLFHNTNGDYDE